MEYTLKNDCLTVVFTTLGCTLHSILDKAGTEQLWQGDAQYWSGQAPVLCFAKVFHTVFSFNSSRIAEKSPVAGLKAIPAYISSSPVKHLPVPFSS